MVEKPLTGNDWPVTPARPCWRDLLGAEWKDGQDRLTPGPFLLEILCPAGISTEQLIRGSLGNWYE